jgi:hypothetical protein
MGNNSYWGKLIFNTGNLMEFPYEKSFSEQWDMLVNDFYNSLNINSWFNIKF